MTSTRVGWKWERVVAVAVAGVSVQVTAEWLRRRPGPRSRQLPRRVEELDGPTLGPFGEHGLLGDEAVAAVGGALVEHVLGALVAAADLVVVVGNLPDALRPGTWRTRGENPDGTTAGPHTRGRVHLFCV